jgi:hypothetical protein
MTGERRVASEIERADLTLDVRELELGQLQELLARVVDLAGCSGCGLAGLDIHILGPVAGPQPEPWLERSLFTEFAGAETFGDRISGAALKGSIVMGS